MRNLANGNLKFPLMQEPSSLLRALMRGLLSQHDSPDEFRLGAAAADQLALCSPNKPRP